MKKSQVTMYIIIAMLLVAGVISIYFLTKKDVDIVIQCQTNSDCVPKTCCHPNSCIPSSEAPDCSGIFCTAVCEPGTLDCNQGSCKCINNKCQAVLE